MNYDNWKSFDRRDKEDNDDSRSLERLEDEHIADMRLVSYMSKAMEAKDE